MTIDDVGTISNTAKDLIDIGTRIINLPTNERQRYRDVLSETYRLLDNAILIPINRLSTILAIPPSDRLKFVNELRHLNDNTKWREVERAVNLCETLYAAGQEMDAATTMLKDKLSIRDRDQLRNIIQKLLDGEKGFAFEINSSVESLAAMADDADKSLEAYEKAREAVRNKKESLDYRRQELIDSEIRTRAVLSPKAKRLSTMDEYKKKPWYRRFW